MKGYLPKIGLILLVVFSYHAATAVACFNCDAMQIDKTEMADCHNAADRPVNSSKDLSCCCSDSPFKTTDAIQKDSSSNIQLIVSITMVTPVALQLENPRLTELALKRYRPFSIRLSASPLALKQSFLI